MKATLTVRLDNAAFEDAPEIELARILRDTAKFLELRGAPDERNLKDSNGNLVGHLTIEGD